MDEYIWRRIFGDSGEGGLAVVFLVGMFCVALWRPQRVARPALFRTAYMLFALAILVPALTEVIFRAAVLDIPRDAGRGERNLFGVPFLVSSVITLVGRIIFGVSVICAFASLDVSRREADQPRGPNE